MDPILDEKLQQELVDCQEPDQDDNKNAIKKGSKSEIISKIYKVHDDTGTVCEFSKTKLMRMTKNELLDLLGCKISEAMTQKINQKLGCDTISEDCNEIDKQRLMAAGFLTMAHNMLCTTCEKGVENYSNYTIDGFSDFFKRPENEQVIQDSLMEIAAEYNVIEYIDSPFAKLGLLWGTGVISTLKKKNRLTL